MRLHHRTRLRTAWLAATAAILTTLIPTPMTCRPALYAAGTGEPTGFTPASAPQEPAISISRAGSYATLSWADNDESTDYEVWRSQDPYFEPADGEGNQIEDLSGDPYGPGSTVEFTDTGLDYYYAAPLDPQLEPVTPIGDVTANHFWVVRGRAGTMPSLRSNRVGEFDFAIVQGS